MSFVDRWARTTEDPEVEFEFVSWTTPAGQCNVADHDYVLLPPERAGGLKADVYCRKCGTTKQFEGNT